MPKRHASSHALATLATVLSATLLATWLRFQYESIMSVFDGISQWILEIVPLSMSREMLTNIVFATVLSAIWGLGFYFLKRK